MKNFLYVFLLVAMACVGSPESLGGSTRVAQHVAIGDPTCSAEDCRCTPVYKDDSVCDFIVVTGQPQVATPSYVRYGNSTGSTVSGTPPTIYETGLTPNDGTSARMYVADFHGLWRTVFATPVSMPSDRYGWVEVVYSFPSSNYTMHVFAHGDIATNGPPQLEVTLVDGNNVTSTPPVYLTTWTNGLFGPTKHAHLAARTSTYNASIGAGWNYFKPDSSATQTFGGPSGAFPGWQAN